MSVIPGQFPGFFSTRTPFGLTFTAFEVRNASGSVYQYLNKDIGAADATRIVIVHVANAVAGTILNVDIGGTLATFVTTSTGTNTRSSLYYAKLTSGTTATITVTFAGAINRCHIQVLRLVGQLSDAPAGSTAAAGGGDTSRNVTLTAPEGGAVLVCGIGGAGFITETNCTELSEITGASEWVEVARYLTPGAAEVGKVFTFNPVRAMLAASWA